MLPRSPEVVVVVVAKAAVLVLVVVVAKAAILKLVVVVVVVVAGTEKGNRKTKSVAVGIVTVEMAATPAVVAAAILFKVIKTDGSCRQATEKKTLLRQESLHKSIV